jgi:hypothetical protein
MEKLQQNKDKSTPNTSDKAIMKKRHQTHFQNKKFITKKSTTTRIH